MDGSSFDRLARLAATGAGRRGVLKSGFALILGGLGAISLLGTDDAEAKKSCKKRCKKKCDGKNNEKQCKKRCKKRCKKQQCGRQGDGCGAYDADTGEYSAPYCCDGYECVYITSNGSSSWTCQPNI